MTQADNKQSSQHNAKDLKDKASSLASDVVDEAKQEGRRVAADVRAEAERLGEERKERVAERAGGLADTLHQTSDSLRGRGETTAASLADSAADHLERFSETLSGKDLKTLIDDAGDLARRHPAVFLGGAVALGFMAARFVRSSAVEHRDAGPAAAAPYGEESHVGRD